MLLCPMCKKGLDGLVRECPRCRTDLSLLVDHVDHLQGGLARADALTRQGKLGEAVWAYLEVLEVDPDNPIARLQVGRVATAVRQFDRASPGRRWLARLQRRAKIRNWLVTGWRDGTWLVVALLVVTALAVGFQIGQVVGSGPPAATSGDALQSP
jgi:hypothetical protein